MAGLPGLPPPGFADLPPPGFSGGDPLGSVEDTSSGVRAGRAAVGGLSKILPFGLGDEIIAGGNSLLDQLPDALGGTGQSLGDAYDSRLSQIRDYQKGFEEEAGNSGANAAVNIGGGFLMPLGMLGKAFSKAPGILPALGNVAKSAGIGSGISAAYGFGEGEGVDDRISKAESGAKTGAVTGGLLGAAGEAAAGTINKLPSLLEEAGKTMNRFSIGATKGSYAKTAQEISPWDIPHGEDASSATKKAVENVLDSGILGKNRDPATMVKIAGNEVEVLSSKLEKTLQAADDTGMVVKPKFPETLALIKEGKAVSAEKIPDAIAKIQTLKDSLLNEGGGKATFLNAQKQTYGKLWKNGDPVDRAIYRDLKNALEHTVPGVRKINSEIQKWKLVDPILRKGLAGKEGRNIIGNVYNYIRTSGAKTIAGPAVAGAAIGGKMGGPVGAALGAGLGVASSPQGNRIIGTALMGASQKLGAVNITPGAVGKAIGLGAVTVGLGLKGKSEKTPQLQRQSGVQKPQNSLTLDKISHVMQKFESNYNPKAVSRAGAIGLMQVMPSTGKALAKELGIEYQPNNPKQNVTLGKAYMLKLITQFKDLPLALAAYNAGPSQVSHLVKKYGNSFDAIKDRLAKPEETIPYVRNIMKELES
jgi:hypothetical protein